MDWITQNWLWIALGVGAVFFMSRMGGCGMSRSGADRHDGGSNTEPPASSGTGSAGSDQDNQQRRTHQHGCC